MSAYQEKHSKYINVTLKMNGDLDKIREVIISTGDFDEDDYSLAENAEILKTMTFEEFSGWIKDGFNKLIDEHGLDIADYAIRYELTALDKDSMHYSDMCKLLIDSDSLSTNEFLAEMDPDNKNYSKWIKNYDKLYSNAQNIASIIDKLGTIKDYADAINNDDGSISDEERREAMVEVMQNVFGIAETLTSYLPDGISELLESEIKAGSKLLGEGAEIINGYLNKLDELEKEIEAEISGKGNGFDFDILNTNEIDFNKSMDEINEAINTYQAVYDFYNSFLGDNKEFCNLNYEENIDQLVALREKMVKSRLVYKALEYATEKFQSDGWFSKVDKDNLSAMYYNYISNYHIIVNNLDKYTIDDINNKTSFFENEVNYILSDNREDIKYNAEYVSKYIEESGGTLSAKQYIENDQKREETIRQAVLVKMGLADEQSVVAANTVYDPLILDINGDSNNHPNNILA